ncbi:MAG: hypothetical protein LBI43_07180 [Streptococcaceae bacterium]|jgi:NAD-dependent deacetylase|nr:hypothetical protein [Streptococcaceae bacterium]
MTRLHDQAEEVLELLKSAHCATALTGAGISASVGIPTLEDISRTTNRHLTDLTWMKQYPNDFWAEFRQIFLTPIFTKGPNISHKTLVRLEQIGILQGLVTTNVDYLHELAGSKRIYDIWWSLNQNRCTTCGRMYPLESLRTELPTCPEDGTMLIPEPIYRQLATDPDARSAADALMAASDLTLVIGCNGYYSHTGSCVININPVANAFDNGAEFFVRAEADTFFEELDKIMVS